MTLANNYDLNDSTCLTAEFVSGSYAINPTAVTLKIKNPANTISTIAMGALTNPEVGTFGYNLTLNMVGQWWYRFEGSGNVIAADEKCLIVDPSEFD